MKFSQAPTSVLMVRPKSFGFNPQTADTNVFQQNATDECESINEMAVAEFDKMVDLLRSNDIGVLVVEDTAQPEKPDAIFPNNWISFHHDGTIVLYPMLAENRRLERINPVIETVKENYSISKTIDLTSYEAENKFLEGTGSVVFDYVNKIAYASRSFRTDELILKDLNERLGFESIVFDAVDEQGQTIYHTNVLMCIGTKFVIICLDAIQDDNDQEKLLESFSNTGHKVIAISFEQLKLFAGNMMEVKARSGEHFVLLSQKAFHSLLPGQLDALSLFVEPIPVNIPTIETYGGGSVRCMVAGIFNPER
jgi:hypothetical protein